MKFTPSLAVMAAAALAGCGGGGGGGSRSGGNTGGAAWQAGMFLPAASFEAQCAAPRSGIDPGTGQAYPDVQGSVLSENNWLRSWSNDLYLWYDEIVDRDPALYTTLGYFDLLRTFASTPSETPKDRFHFTIPTAEWETFAQSGAAVGYGAEWSLLSSAPPRQIVVAYTQPNSPAASQGIARGAEVLQVDGVDLVNAADSASIDILNAGLFPTQANETHTLAIRDLGAQSTRAVTLTSASITAVPVQNVTIIQTQTGPVGYALFNDHVATAEQELVDAINQLKTAGVTDLVLDIRYNGGGYLDIASEAAYMIAGAGPTAGRIFEQMQFNAKHPVTNPVTGAALAPVGFHTTTLGFSVTANQPLPTLDLPRVYVLTGPDTCSASESIINSLRGVGVEVVQVGSTTCGKPYGFYPTDNCGTTYFSIQFKGVNALGFGDYTDGFSPANTQGTTGTMTPGCSVADDYSHALGDTLESRLQTALAVREGQACPVPTGLAVPGVARAARPLAAVEGHMRKSPWRENRILVR